MRLFAAALAVAAAASPLLAGAAPLALERRGGEARGAALAPASARSQAARSQAAVARPAAAEGSERGSAGPRAIWITRWDWREEAELRALVARCAGAGFDALLFQVRGSADAWCRASSEPWAEELGGEDPGFDPLAVAIEEAHARGLALHAWVNVMPSWRGRVPPRNAEHVWHARPEWHWQDAAGERQALCEGFYVSLNPCLPEVRAHLVRVIGEIASDYAIDGLHLDYLRFPNEPPALPRGRARDFPRDARTLERFRADTSLAPDDDPEAWDEWRAGCVTRLVRELRAMLRRERPGAELSAALSPTVESARSHHQDWPRWLAEGLLDRAYPMNYSADPAVFGARLADWRARAGATPITMGVMLSGAEPGLRLAQLEAAHGAFGSFCAFGYAALFDSANEVLERQDEAARAARRERAALLLPRLAAIAAGTD